VQIGVNSHRGREVKHVHSEGEHYNTDTLTYSLIISTFTVRRQVKLHQAFFF